MTPGAFRGSAGVCVFFGEVSSRVLSVVLLGDPGLSLQRAAQRADESFIHSLAHSFVLAAPRVEKA